MKKILCLSLFLCLFSKVAFTQSYREMMNEPDKYSFKQIQDAFYSEWNKKPIEERMKSGEEENGEGEYYQFKRWEELMRTHLDENGRVFNYSAKNFEEILKEQNSGLRDQVVGLEDWKSMGPSGYVRSGGNSGGIGRVNCIAFHPTNPNTIWVGTPAGGLWKTTDHGDTWVPLTDNLDPGLGVSGIAVNPHNPDIIYILTGDGDHGDVPSIGVLKTIDGGLHWSTVLPFTNRNTRAFKLVMHPQNPDTMLVATNGGVLVTFNGFASVKTQLPKRIVYDIEFHPTDPRFVYLATDSNYVYRSISGGKNWLNMNIAGEGLPAAGHNLRTALAVSANKPNRLYAAFADDDGFVGLYMSNNKGRTFIQTTINTDINVLAANTDGSGNSNQAGYDFTLACPPDAANTILIGGINIWGSTTKGSAWVNLTDWVDDGSGNGHYVHGDQHALEISPLTHTMYSGNDGGIYYSTDVGETWTNMTTGLIISQIYRITKNDPSTSSIYYGAQDNGVNSFPVSSNIGHSIIGGDGSAVAFNNGNVFAANNFGKLWRHASDNIYNVTWDSITPVHAGKPSSELIYYPLVTDPVNDGTIWAGYNALYKSTNNGDDWTLISEYTGNSNIERIAVSTSSPQQIFIATATYVAKLQEGATMSVIIYGLPLPLTNHPVTDICLADSPSISGKYAWVSLGGYDSIAKVYRTRDGGTNWINESSGLPNVPVNCLAYAPGYPNYTVFAGTEIGVYYKDTTMTDWATFNVGMPFVKITDLKVDTATNTLYAATFGRGIWKTLLSCFNPLTTAVITGEYLMCAGESIPLTADGPCGYDSYQWSTGETTQSISVTANGVYTVTISDGTNSLTASHHLSAPGAGIVWEKTLQGSAVGITTGYSIEQTTDDGYIVASVINQPNIDSAHGGGDWLITKLDQGHNVLWSTSLGGSLGEDNPRAQQTADGGFIISGRTQSNDGDVEGKHPNDIGLVPDYYNDYWLVKLNAGGAVAWKKCLGGPGDEGYYSSVQQTKDGGYVVAGTVSENGGDVIGYAGGGNTNVWIVKLDADRNILWQKFYTGDARCIRQTSDGGFIVAGIIFVPFHYFDYLILKLDSAGNLLWQKSYGGPGYDDPLSIQQIKDGGYVVAGSEHGNGGDVTENHPYPNSYTPSQDYWIVKLDSVGNLKWQKSLGGSGDDIATSIQQTTEGDFIVAGSTSSNDGDVTGFHPTNIAFHSGQDSWIVKLDTGRNLLWQKCLGDSNIIESANSIQQTNDGTFIIAGSTSAIHDGPGGTIETWLVDLAAGCPAPFRDFDVNNVTSTSATLHWGTRDCVDGYRVSYFQNQDFDLYPAEIGNVGSLDISGLTPSTEYNWTVESRCVFETETIYSKAAQYYFTTLPVKLEEEKQFVFDCSLYPNPTTGNFSLDITSTGSGTAKIEIRTLLGNLIYSDNLPVNEQHNTYVFNSVFPSQGLYIVTISLNNEKVVRKILRSN